MCTQLGHLPNLLKNRVNSQQNPSLCDIWKLKIAEDIEKQMIRRLFRNSKLVPGTLARAMTAGVSGLAPGMAAAARASEESQISNYNFTALFPPRAGKSVPHQESPRCLKSLGGIKTHWETHRGSVPQLGLWLLAGTVSEKLGSQVTPGDGRRVGLSRCKQREFAQKSSQPLFKEL